MLTSLSCNERDQELSGLRAQEDAGMELLERIEEQIEVTQLPLFAITVAAVPCPDTPVILTLHWHAFVRERLADVETAQVVSFKSVPSSALQVNAPWDDLTTIDRA